MCPHTGMQPFQEEEQHLFFALLLSPEPRTMPVMQ